jgi:hypothetical protein
LGKRPKTKVFSRKIGSSARKNWGWPEIFLGSGVFFIDWGNFCTDFDPISANFIDWGNFCTDFDPISAISIGWGNFCTDFDPNLGHFYRLG